MSSILMGMIMPHPPILVPFIGGKRIKDAKKTQDALKIISGRLKTIAKELDLIVVITPHGAVSDASVPVYTGHAFEGNFASFGAPKPNFQFKGDPNFAIALVKEAEKYATRSYETLLDHGVLVPLYYPGQAIGAIHELPLLPIAVGFLPLYELFEFGKKITSAAERLNKKIAVIASADMSHRLTHDAPAGYNPKGIEFDQKLVELVKNYDVDGILNFPPDLAEEAGQDALWSIAILLGALDKLNLKAEVLSYEGPFGVGYMAAQFGPKE